jgi:transcriptional regulator with XRE-family HTH domain
MTTLWTLRTRRGWTQDDLAQRSKIPQNTIARLEGDRSVQPRWQTVLALAKALAVDPLTIAFGPPRRKTRAASASGGAR